MYIYIYIIEYAVLLTQRSYKHHSVLNSRKRAYFIQQFVEANNNETSKLGIIGSLNLD